MLVAIIDTGIQPDIFPIGPIMYDMEVTRFGIVRRRKGKIHSFHGTLVAAILEKYAPGCEICSIKIFDDETQKTTCRILCAALRWCRRRGIPIINVSAGSVEVSDFGRIERAIDALTRTMQIVVAAYNKDGIPTMPASHNMVIGVRTTDVLKDTECFLDNTSGKQDCYAAAQHELRFLSGGKIVTPAATSFCAPLVTATIVNIIRSSIES